MSIISGIGPQAGSSSIVGGATLPSSPTFRQVFMTSGGLYVCLSNGNWTLLEAGTTTGEVTGNGVTNRLTKWIDGSGSVLGDSGVADDGTNVLSLRPFAVGFGLSTPAQLLTGPRITAASIISTSPRGIQSNQYSADTAGARVGLQKARGTVGTPVVITTGDVLGQVIFRGFDGTGYLDMGSISCNSTGTIATSRVPTTLTFATATDANPSVLTTALTLGANQAATFASTVAGAFNGTLGATTPATAAVTTLSASSTSVLTDDVGIGAASDGTRLDVRDAGSASAITTIVRIENSTTAVGAGEGAAVDFVLGTDNGTRTVAGQVAVLWTDSANANRISDMVFYTKASGVSAAEAMRIDSAKMVTAVGTFKATGITTDAAHTDSTVCQDTTSHVFYAGSGAAGICLGTSSARFKENISDIKEGLAEVLKLVPRNFRYKKGYVDDGDRLQFGLVAEEVNEIMPNVVAKGAKGEINSVDYGATWVVLIKALQEMHEKFDAQVELLNTRLNTLIA